MVRIIDSDAINKRVFADIANTFQHSSKITGEKTVQDFSGTDDRRAAAVDNFNFNGIEFSKIKQMINYIQTHNKQYAFEQILGRVDVAPKTTSLSQYGTVDGEELEQNHDNKGASIADIKTYIDVPNGFDGRNSFVYPRIVLSYGIFDAEIMIGEYDYSFSQHDYWFKNTSGYGAYSTTPKNIRYNFRELSQNESFHLGLAMQGDVNNINCWSAPISGKPSSWLMVDKQKLKIIVTANANLAVYNAGYDADSYTSGHALFPTAKDITENNHIVAAYVDILCVYWRDK